jgi:hypothetical protein
MDIGVIPGRDLESVIQRHRSMWGSYRTGKGTCHLPVLLAGTGQAQTRTKSRNTGSQSPRRFSS